jgi:hypothetical protein
MDGHALRLLQAPVKQRYRDDPESAITPVEAVATFDEPGFTCSVPTWSGPVTAGLVGVGNVEIEIAVEADADDAKLAKLAAVTERCCVVGQSLHRPVRVRVERDRAPGILSND